MVGSVFPLQKNIPIDVPNYPIPFHESFGVKLVKRGLLHPR